jgi:hypothetical protein
MACEIKLMRRTVGYKNLDHKGKEDNLMELKPKPITDCIKHRRSHENRTNDVRFPKAISRRRPKNKRSIGSSTKRRRINQDHNRPYGLTLFRMKNKVKTTVNTF